MRFTSCIILSTLVLSLCCAAHAQRAYPTHPGQPAPRAGDEIMVCGQLFHTGAPVVLWIDTGGYDASRAEGRSPTSSPSQSPSTGRRGRLQGFSRASVLTDEELERVRANGWDLDLLKDKIDQFVIH